jgi:hypothetical protein
MYLGLKVAPGAGLQAWACMRELEEKGCATSLQHHGQQRPRTWANLSNYPFRLPKIRASHSELYTKVIDPYTTHTFLHPQMVCRSKTLLKLTTSSHPSPFGLASVGAQVWRILARVALSGVTVSGQTAD